jgi:hypothetical protein
MKLEKHELIADLGAGRFVPSSFVVAERARRESSAQERHDPLPGVVDLAKQPGLLYRLHAILND